MKLGSEQGFTFVEVVTSLLILSIVAGAALPMVVELRTQQQKQDERFEAMHHLQARLEQTQRAMVRVPEQGMEEKESKWTKGVTYQVIWRKTRYDRFLYKAEVKVTWKGRQGEKQTVSRSALQYAPVESGVSLILK
ncbi:type II secretion system protein [Mechercharimyces sp. CAU 1602]|uniref:type II secretion system protein n=1 Tax=Mechercharimyces sp. CAU 1602 TaxID=2973933 RepID=UPI002163184C|nr:type II secretion system protein [Mechercharimyces sp. CAU 1602]MCS1350546.1 type II secretion system GspH family protein [Mechercharimyces sp. CAU 1602]